MTNKTEKATMPQPTLKTVDLKTPIIRGEQVFEKISVQAPNTGHLRGLKLMDVLHMDVDTMLTLISRVSYPTITEAEVAQLSGTDLVKVSAEVVGFFGETPNAASAASPTA